MLSRVADSIYWMNRYVERADNVARFIDVNLQLILDMPRIGAAEQWEPLVIVSGDHEPFLERHGKATRESVVYFLTFDEGNPNSIASCLRAARESARSVREAISTDMWEQLNKAYLMVRDAASAGVGPLVTGPYDFFDRVKEASAMFVGMTDATMTHGDGWHFGRMGRLLERADKTSRILDVKYFILLPQVEDVGTPFDDIQWAALLRSASAFEMYRQRHGRIRPNLVVEFLLLGRTFPRAVRYCLTKANESLHAVSGSPLGEYANAAERQLGALRADFAYKQVDQIIASGLHEFIDALQVRVNDVGDAVFRTFFELRPIADTTATLRRTVPV
jgi:uncharacterized alpha-E superfamily protein